MPLKVNGTKTAGTTDQKEAIAGQLAGGREGEWGRVKDRLLEGPQKQRGLQRGKLQKTVIELSRCGYFRLAQVRKGKADG